MRNRDLSGGRRPIRPVSLPSIDRRDSRFEVGVCATNDLDRCHQLSAAVKGVSVEEPLRDDQGGFPQAEPGKPIINVYPID